MRVLCVFVAIAAQAAFAASAAAQSSTTDPLQNASLRFGSLGLTPALVLKGMGTDENVFNDPDHPKSDFTFTLTPRADVVFAPSFMRVSFTTVTDYVYYRRYASERSTNQSSSVRVDVPVWRFEPFVTAAGVNTRERPNEEVDVRARHHDRTYGGGLAVKLATRTSVTVGVRRTRSTYDAGAAFRGEDLRRAFDNRLDVVEGRIGIELTPITTFSVIGSTERQRFDFAPERDADTVRLTPTFSFVPDGVISGSIGVGYRRFRALSPELPDFSGLVASGTIGITIGSRYRVDTTIGRDLRYSYERDAPYYLATGVSGGLTIFVGGPVDVRVTGRREAMAYHAVLGSSTAIPDDTYSAYGAELGYRLRHRFRFSVNGEWDRRLSKRDRSREFRNHRVYGALTWGTPQ